MDLGEVVYTFALYASCMVVPYLIFLVIYRVSIHPLHQYPGPLIAKITDGYAGWQALARRTHMDILQKHTKYGPVVRYSPNRLLFNTVTAFQEIYSSPRITKSHVYVASRLGTAPSLFSTFERDLHRKKRQIMGQPINDRSMRIFEPTMTGQVEIFLRLLSHSSEISEPVNMTDRCQRLGFDVIGHLAFGCDLKMQTEETNRVMIRLLTKAKIRVNAFMHFPALQSLDFILKALPNKDTVGFKRIISEIIKSRTAEAGRGQHDLYALMAEHTKPGGLYDGILWSEAIFFMTAGGTPPATTMSALFFYLSRYPGCYSKLAHEIRSTFSSGRDIRGGAALSGCKYLRACIDESLRMAPPSLATLWREQAADDPQRGAGPIVIDGHIIPPSTQVGVNLYALHHNAEYFPDPSAFSPERWADGSDGEKTDKHRAFAPFIIGPRSCAGRAMAYLEISLVVAKTMWYFDFEKAPGPLGEVGQGEKRDGGGFGQDEFNLVDMFNADHDGPYLVFQRRVDCPDELD